MNQKSKIIISILGLIVVGLGGLLLKEKNSGLEIVAPTEEEGIATMPNTQTEKKIVLIKEENFYGSRPVFTKNTLLEKQAEAYIQEEIDAFKNIADEEVPQKRQEENDQSHLDLYTIDIRATNFKSPTTQSIVIDKDTYTGGANDYTTYKTFTISEATGKNIVLSNVILSNKQIEFTAYVKKALQGWRPEKSSTSVVFPEEVQSLTFSSFTNWSLDSNNLILYFDKYTIGPGALGAIAFPLPLSKIQTYIAPLYQ